MICKNCGAKNNDSRIKCFHCNSVLNTNNSYIYEDSSSLKDFPDDISAELNGYNAEDEHKSIYSESEGFFVESLNNEDASDEMYQGDAYGETYDEYEDEIYPEENDSYEVEADEYEDGDYEDENYNSEAIEDDEYEDYDEDSEPDDDSEDAPESKSISELSVDDEVEQHFKVYKKKKTSGLTVAIWILCLVFIIVAIFVGTFIYSYLNPEDTTYIPPVDNTVASLGITQPTIQKLTDEKGVEYVHVTFSGQVGDRVNLKCNNSYHTFISETLEIDLYLEDLFDIEYEFRESTVNANLNAYYVRDNKSYSYAASSFTMSVPEAELELLNPTQQTVKAYRDKFTLKLWTATDSVIYLNNNNISSALNGLGNLSYDITVEENSSTTYQLMVTQPYHTPKSAVFILTRDPLPVSLTIATSNASVISDNKITISGSTEEGAKITANLPTIGEIEKNELYNTFTAVLDLSGCKYGEIEVIITAESEKGFSSKSHVFLYWPDETKITKSSGKFTSTVATNPSKYKGSNFVLNSATVVKNVSANSFEAKVSLNGIDYPVIIENEFGSTTISVNSKYKIFAECTGTLKDGKPVFRAWYIYTAK